MKGQMKKGLKLAALGTVVAIMITILPVSALAANYNPGSISASDILSALQKNNFSSNGRTTNSCSPSDILNSLKSGNCVDLNSLYKHLYPSSSPSYSAKPCTPTASPAATVTPKPAVTPAAPSTVKPSTDASDLEKQMVDLINAERAKAGISALRINDKVTEVARAKSKDMIDKDYFSHTSPTYGSPFQMLTTFGVSYRAAGENIATNRSMQNAHTALMNSSGHRQNILSSSYKSIGIGIVANARGYLYITQMFIG